MGGSTNSSEVFSSKMTGVAVELTQKPAKHNLAMKAGTAGRPQTGLPVLFPQHSPDRACAMFSELVNSGHESPNKRPGAIKPPI